jgi:hypothetical protein
MLSEESIRRQLEAAARELYGSERARELSKRLGEIARWTRLIDQQPLDVLDEEPDDNGR